MKREFFYIDFAGMGASREDSIRGIVTSDRSRTQEIDVYLRLKRGSTSISTKRRSLSCDTNAIYHRRSRFAIHVQGFPSIRESSVECHLETSEKPIASDFSHALANRIQLSRYPGVRKKKMLLIKYNIFHEIGYGISLFYEPRTSIPIFLSRGFTRWQFAEWKVQDLSVSLSPPFRLSFAISSTLSRSFISDVSRGLAAVAAAAAWSPSEVKVRRVGTGCARIHFFGLALDFFPLFPDGEAHRISFPCMRRRPSLHGRHALHRISLSISPPLSLFLSLFRPRPRCIAR